jgi:dipeptidyl aminopeptidase/acylaminoacyl peptidase
MEIEVRDSSLGVYLFSAKWVTLFDKNVLIAIWANRYQNHTTITLCTFDSGKCVHNYEQRYTLGGMKLWAEPEDYQDVKSFHTDTSFFILLPSQKPSGDIFTQIAKITVTPNLATAKVAFLSMAEYDVDKINYFDSKNNLIYYTAAAPNPTQKHLYVASANPNIIGQSRCVTCNVSPQNCSYHESSFSNNGNHFFMNCKGPGTPHVIMTSISSNFKNLAEYGRNPYLEKATTFSGVLPKVRFENITLRNGFVSQVKMLIPPSLETSSVDKRYPVLVDVYGGPGSQKATEEWLANNIDIYFASNPEYIVVFIDGRGSGNRGWKQKAPIYGNFGTVEVDDQIETIRRLLTKHKFMDKRRVAIWGWSYGGFVATKAIERDPKQTFRCAAAVAPVSHFKYYDATYTERYMGAASSDAYSETDLTKNVTAFHDINFLLVHGTADDNVHFQNTAVFVKALSDENVQFDLAVYTDDSHNLASSRWALYNKLSIFLSNCFNDKKLY